MRRTAVIAAAVSIIIAIFLFAPGRSNRDSQRFASLSQVLEVPPDPHVGFWVYDEIAVDNVKNRFTPHPFYFDGTTIVLMFLDDSTTPRSERYYRLPTKWVGNQLQYLRRTREKDTWVSYATFESGRFVRQMHGITRAYCRRTKEAAEREAEQDFTDYFRPREIHVEWAQPENAPVDLDQFKVIVPVP